MNTLFYRIIAFTLAAALPAAPVSAAWEQCVCSLVAGMSCCRGGDGPGCLHVPSGGSSTASEGSCCTSAASCCATDDVVPAYQLTGCQFTGDCGSNSDCACQCGNGALPVLVATPPAGSERIEEPAPAVIADAPVSLPARSLASLRRMQSQPGDNWSPVPDVSTAFCIWLN